MDAMSYLFAVCAAIGVIRALYLFSLRARERRLRDEIERLKRLIEKS